MKPEVLDAVALLRTVDEVGRAKVDAGPSIRPTETEVPSEAEAVVKCTCGMVIVVER